MNKKRFIITEQQFNRFIINEMINEGVFKNICNRLFGECETF
jgi:hypothetical protein